MSALVSSVSAGGDGSTVTTAAIDTTGANLIVASVAWYQPGGASAFTDSKGNTYTKAPTGSSDNNSVLGVGHTLYFCVSPTVSIGHAVDHTFTSTPGGGFPAVCVMAFSGAVTTSTKDHETGNNGLGGTLKPGSLTPGADDTIVVTGVTTGLTTGTVTVDSGFSYASGSPAVGAAFQCGGAYKFVGTAAAQDPEWTFDSGGYGNAATMVSFLGTAGSPPPPSATKSMATLGVG